MLHINMEPGMKTEHRESIIKHFPFIVNNCKVDKLLPKLHQKGLFTDQALSNFKKKEGADKARQFFHQIQDKGPKAFKFLIDALQDTNQLMIAEKLDPGKEFIHIEEVHHNGAVPFQFPINECKTHDIEQLKQSQFIIDAISEPIQVCVKPSTTFHDDPTSKVDTYSTRSRNRGAVKIINMYDVVDHNPRRGSEHDVTNLTDLFEQIGLTVESHSNLNGKEVLEATTNFVNDDQLKNADMAVLVIMSHGGILNIDPRRINPDTIHLNNLEYLYGSDGERIFLKDIEALFSNRNCQLLQNKPKIIIYQLCRGKEDDYAVASRIDTDGVSNAYMTSYTDILVCHSTTPGFKSHRDKFVGSWYIQYLCSVFMNHAHDTHIEDMLKMVNSNLLKNITPKHTMQVGESSNKGLCKHLYFNPGIYEQNGDLFKF